MVKIIWWSPTTPVLNVLTCTEEYTVYYYLMKDVNEALIETNLTSLSKPDRDMLYYSKSDWYKVQAFKEILINHGFIVDKPPDEFGFVTILKKENAKIVIHLNSMVINFMYYITDMYACFDIINEYVRKIESGDMSKKAAILACQKKLIDNGFAGNATW